MSNAKQIYEARVEYYKAQAGKARENGEHEKAEYYEERVKYYEENSKIASYHGAVSQPETMAMVCEDLGLIQRWQNNELEGGKNFPSFESGLFLGFPTDAMSAVPPADGHILSGGKEDGRDCVNFTNEEMRVAINKDFDWKDYSIKVKGNDRLDIDWQYTMAHKTRGYDWWITKEPVDFSHRLTRDDFENEPFYKNYSSDQPFWSHELPASSHHSVTLPDKEAGAYVLLERWIVADTGMAFHQSWVLEYGENEMGLAGDTVHQD